MTIQKQLQQLIEALRLATITQTVTTVTISSALAEELLNYISGENHPRGCPICGRTESHVHGPDNI